MKGSLPSNAQSHEHPKPNRRKAARGSSRGSAAFKSRWLVSLLLLPTAVILLIFLYYPLLQSVVVSLYRSNIFLGTRDFVGLDNYRSIFFGTNAERYRQVILQSVTFSTLVVIFGIGIGMCLSLLANQQVFGARIYRILLIWPFALSPAVAGVIFSFMFNPESGLVNQYLATYLGIRPRWLDTPSLAFILVVVAAVWKNIGYNVVFYLAALQNVPRELSEAAAIDGANGWQRFWSITFPMLSPMTFFLVFTNLVYSFFDSFGLIDVLTSGGPVGPPPFDNAGVTTTFIYEIYQRGFEGAGRTGLAAAQSVVLLFVVVGITILQFRYGGRRVHYGGES